MNLSGFNAQDVDPPSFEAMPKGWYPMFITESEEKQNNAGTGSYLQLVLEVTEGPYKGRRLWERLNLNHPNEIAVKIAQEKLSAICRAVGVLSPQTSEELHFKPLMVKVGVQKDDKDRSEPKGYKATGSGSPAPSSGGQSAKSSTPPWQR